MTKRQEAAMETRKAIVAAAGRLIAERGLDAISVEDITDAAGVCKGSFYTYFEHKEDVLDEVAYPRFDDILRKSLESKGSLHEKISHFLTESVRYISDVGIHMCQGWVGCSVSPDDEGGKKKMEYDRRAIEELLYDRAENTEWILNEYYGIVFRWALSDGKVDPMREMERFCEGPLKMIMGD